MEQYLATMFEDIRHERRLILLLSLTDPDIIKQSKFKNQEIDIVKNLPLQKLHRQKCFKEYFALQLIE